MRRLLKITIFFVCVGLFGILCSYFFMISILQKNGITYSEKDFDFPFSLKVNNLQVSQPDFSAQIAVIEIELSLTDLIRGKISGDYLIITDGIINYRSSEVSGNEDTDILKNLIPISFKKVKVSHVSLANYDDGDTLSVSIPELIIANMHLGKNWHIDSLSINGSELLWLSHSISDKSEVKTDTTYSGFSLADIPEFTIDNLDFIDCEFYYQTPTQKHSVKNFNLELFPEKKNKLFSMAVREFSLTYQDTLDIDLHLNKILINEKDDIQLTNLLFDFPLLKLDIPQLNITNINSPMVNVQIRESFFNTELLKLFLEPSGYPFKHDLNVNFDGNMSYHDQRLGFENFAMALSDNSDILINGYAGLPGNPNPDLQLKIDRLNTTTADLEKLFNLEKPESLRPINIHGSFDISGELKNLQASGSISLNNLNAKFNAKYDQRNTNAVAFGLAVSSPFVNLNQWLDSMETKIEFSNFNLSSQGILDANSNLVSVSAKLKSDSFRFDSLTTGTSVAELNFSKNQTSVTINLPELLTFSFRTPDDLRGNKIHYTGSIESIIPQLVNTDSIAGEFFSTFRGHYFKEGNEMSLNLILDKIRFEMNSFDKVYESNAALLASQYSNGDLHLNISLDGAQLLDFKTTSKIFDWWNQDSRWRGNFPETELESALEIDSILVKQFTGQSGLIELNNLLISANESSISLNVDMPVFFVNNYDFRDVSGNFNWSEREYDGLITVNQFLNPFILVNELHIGAGQIDENTAKLSISGILPEIQNSIELNTLISSYDSLYIVNFDRNFLHFGDNTWQNNNSKGFIFNKSFDLLSGDISLVNGNQMIEISTLADKLSFEVDSLILDPIGEMLINDTTFHSKLNVSGTYQLTSQNFEVQGVISDIVINSRMLGALNFNGNQTIDELKAGLILEEKYGQVDFSVNRFDGPYNYNLDVQELDLTFVNKGMPWENLIPVSGKVNARLDGTYGDELKSNGFIGFDNVETQLTENKIYLKADRDTLWFKDQFIYARDFKLFDKKGQSIALDGTISMTSDPVIDMVFRTSKFRVLDAENNSKSIKGVVDISSELNVKRSPDQFKIGGNMAVSPQSSIKYLFESTVSLDEREQEIRFVSFGELENQKKDTLTNYRITNRTKPIEWDVKLDVGKSTIEIVLNETYQDNIKMVAEGNFLLKTGSNDQPYFFGTLKSNEGSIAYDAPMVSDISLKIENVLIKWEGEFDKPRMTFQGYETFRVQPKGIPGMSNSNEVVPIDVVVRVKDKPIEDFVLTFDLNSSNAKVKSWIQSLPEDTREANAINLLLFGTLNFGETAGDPSLVQTLASKMNEISRRNIKNADLSFYSANQDVSSIKSESKDKLGYNFSKGLGNKHFKISIGGTLDFNHDQDPDHKKSTAIPDIQLDYSLSESPDITLNAAQKNIYDGVINGQVGESSVGITYLMRFRNIFKSFNKQVAE